MKSVGSLSRESTVFRCGDSLGFSGQFALPVDFLRPYPGYSDITYNSMDGNSSYDSLQVSLQRRFSKAVTLGVAYTLSKVKTTISDETTFTHVSDPRGYDYALANFDRTHYFVANYVWNLPKVSQRLGDSWLSRAVFDNWILSGISSIATGNPLSSPSALPGRMPEIAFSAPTRTAICRANNLVSRSAELPKTHPTRSTGFYRARYQRHRPIPAQLFAQPRLQQPRSLGYSRTFLSEGMARASFSCAWRCFNVFNHTQHSAVNRTTNITNGSGATGANIFNDYTNLSITNNTRPSGNSNVLGTHFGEYSAARDPRFIRLAVKVYF